MKLIIVHYHLRPGGIRRIIESATPHLVRHFRGAIDTIVLAAGEGAEPQWRRLFRRQFRNLKIRVFLEPRFSYLSEQDGPVKEISDQIRSALAKLLGDIAPAECLVWAHNLGLGRNLLLTRELLRACHERGITLVAHHHDWWFENRWLRWAELRESGFPTLDAVGKTVFQARPKLFHVAINRADASVLRRHFPGRVGWWPNLTEPMPAPSRTVVRQSRDWLRDQLGDDRAPIWTVPCRVLRRKNIAEALLLARWLRPEAWLITTAPASSADEALYADRLTHAAQLHGWRLRLGILHTAEPRRPGVAEVLAASEAVLLTSVQEGFGLPYLEAAAARRPLLARRLPNVAPDLRVFGFHFPQAYDEIRIDPALFDWRAEQRRQGHLFRQWKSQLPRGCRDRVGQPQILTAGQTPRPVPFSRLTLTAQLEVLAQPVERSWALCARLNSFLTSWRRCAAAGSLKVTPWPAKANRWLSGAAYARRFRAIIGQRVGPMPTSLAWKSAQEEFIRVKLGAENLFPLLWARQT